MTRLIFPRAVLDQHLVVLGKTGAGKSSALRHIVEYLLAHDKRVCVIDPKGDWNGLKVSADGKGPGFPIILFGDFKETAGRSIPADVPLNEYSGKHVAELVTSGNRPCVIGLRGWTMAAMHRFWVEFASTFFNTNEGEIYLVVDEVHNFAPKGSLKGKEGNVSNSLHWTNRLLSEARGLGAVMLIASQRPQKVHNDTLTACETLVAMRVVHQADRAAIEDWIKGNGDKDVSAEVLNSLAGMKRGEAYVWSPEVGFGPERLTFPMFTTFDSFAPPQLQKKVSGKDWASVDLDLVKQKLAAVIEKAKAEDPHELNKIIAELRKQVAQLEKNATARPQDAKRIQELTDLLAAERAKEKPAGKPKVVEKKIIVAGDLTRLANEGDRVAVLVRESGRHTVELEKLHEKISATINEAKALNAQEFKGVTYYDPEFFEQADFKKGTDVRPMPRPVIDVNKAMNRAREIVGGNGSLPEGEAKILSALIQYPNGLERGQIAVFTGYHKRSTRNTYIQRLSARAYIDVTSDRITATEEGRAALPNTQPLPTGEELQRFWLTRLPEGEAKILQVLISAYPNALSRDVISERTGYDKPSTRNTYLQRLGAKELVSGSAAVKASDNLF